MSTVTKFVETRTTTGFYVNTESLSYIGTGDTGPFENGNFTTRFFRLISGVLISRIKVTKLVRNDYKEVYSFREVGPFSFSRPTVYLSGGAVVIVDGVSGTVRDFYNAGNNS